MVLGCTLTSQLALNSLLILPDQTSFEEQEFLDFTVIRSYLNKSYIDLSDQVLIFDLN